MHSPKSSSRVKGRGGEERGGEGSGKGEGEGAGRRRGKKERGGHPIV